MLSIYYNGFAGLLPAEGFMNKQFLDTCHMDSNRFRGKLMPGGMKDLLFLRVLWLDRNEFAGSLPVEALV
eukprot:1130660-Amphidinium_carterae.1